MRQAVYTVYKYLRILFIGLIFSSCNYKQETAYTVALSENWKIQSSAKVNVSGKVISKNSGLTILPDLWSDNYISILPGETRTYSAKIRKGYLKNEEPEFEFNRWNVISH